jgi:hypothetical protein
MHNSGELRRGNAKLRLRKIRLFEIEVGVCAELARQDGLVMPGLDPGIHHLRNYVFRMRWITGSSPVMTISIGMTALGLVVEQSPQAAFWDRS